MMEDSNINSNINIISSNSNNINMFANYATIKISDEIYAKELDIHNEQNKNISSSLNYFNNDSFDKKYETRIEIGINGSSVEIIPYAQKQKSELKDKKLQTLSFEIGQDNEEGDFIRFHNLSKRIHENYIERAIDSVQNLLKVDLGNDLAIFSNNMSEEECVKFFKKTGLYKYFHDDIKDEALGEIYSQIHKDLYKNLNSFTIKDKKTLHLLLGLIDINKLDNDLNKNTISDDERRNLKKIKQACISSSITNTPYTDNKALEIDLKTIYDYYNKDEIGKYNVKFNDEKSETLASQIQKLNRLLAYTHAKYIEKQNVKDLKTWQDVDNAFDSYVNKTCGFIGNTLDYLSPLMMGGGLIHSLSSFMLSTNTKTSESFTLFPSLWTLFSRKTVNITDYTSPLLSFAVAGLGFLGMKSKDWLKKKNFLNTSLEKLNEPLYVTSIKRKRDFLNAITAEAYEKPEEVEPFEQSHNSTDNFELNYIKLDGCKDSDVIFESDSIKSNDTTLKKKQIDKLNELTEKQRDSFANAYHKKFCNQKYFWEFWKDGKNYEANIDNTEDLEMKQKALKDNNKDGQAFITGSIKQWTDENKKEKHYLHIKHSKNTSYNLNSLQKIENGRLERTN